MKHTNIILLSALLLPLLWANAEGRPVSAGKPNMILFLVDDMGLMDTSVSFVTDAEETPVRHPLNDFYRTPNMEKLAAAGTRFTSFYAHSVCSPARASIMTGQNSARHRTTTWIRPQGNNSGAFGPTDWCWTGLNKDSVTLPRLLKNAGYRTIHVGKAHFGPNEHEGADPLNLGFDVNVGGFSAGQPGSYYAEKNYAREGTTGQVPHLEKYHGSDVFLTEALTLEANRHIEESVQERKPFFLHMSHYAVHAPFESDPRFAENYAQSGEKKHAAAYATLIEGMDKSLGDLVEKLNALGVADNTLIMFLGDNGSDAPLGPVHGYASSAPFRGKKGTHFEGGMRVPFIAAWAKVNKTNAWQDKLSIPAGTIQPQIGTILDILPTLCNLAGVTVPDEMPIDGYDLTQQLAGKRHETRREDFLNHFPHEHRSSYYTSYVNAGWKLIYHYPVPDKGRRRQNPLPKTYELFNLKDDPFEKNDLADSHPEKVQTMLTALRKDLAAKNALYPAMGTQELLPGEAPEPPAAQAPAASSATLPPFVKAVRASSHELGNLPVYAVDADKTSRWAARDGSFPQFLEIELQAAQQAKGVTVSFRNKTMIRYTIDGFGPDGTWITLVDQSENKEKVQTVTHSFDAELTKLEVTVLEAQTGWATITDLQIGK